MGNCSAEAFFGFMGSSSSLEASSAASAFRFFMMGTRASVRLRRAISASSPYRPVSSRRTSSDAPWVGFGIGISFFAARFFASDSGIANFLKMNLTLYYMFFSVP